MTAWSKFTARDFDTQAAPPAPLALFPVDSQGRLGGDLFEPAPEPDSAETITATGTTAPAMTDAEISALPRPVQQQARDIRDHR